MRRDSLQCGCTYSPDILVDHPLTTGLVSKYMRHVTKQKKLDTRVSHLDREARSPFDGFRRQRRGERLRAGRFPGPGHLELHTRINRTQR